jgi:hypothetical protein
MSTDLYRVELFIAALGAIQGVALGHSLSIFNYEYHTRKAKKFKPRRRPEKRV